MRRCDRVPAVASLSMLLAGAAVAQLPARVIVQSGDPMPGSTGGTVNGLWSRDAAQGWKDHALLGVIGSPQSTVLLAGPFGQLRVVAANGAPVPPVPGATYSITPFGMIAGGGASSMAFECVLIGLPNSPRSVLAGNPQTVREVVRFGQSLGSGLTALSWARPSRAQDADITTTLIGLSGPGVTAGNDTALLLNRAGVTGLLVREGDPAPELPGRVLGSFSITSLPVNNLGQVAALASSSGGGGSGTAIFRFGPESHRVVAYAGMPAPGVGPDQVFAAFPSASPVIDNTGRVLFLGTVTGRLPAGQGPQGLWHGPPGVSYLVARTGWPAPGADPGVNLQIVLDGIPRPMCNDVGEVAFVSVLTGPGVSGANNRALFAGSANQLRMICRTGSALPGSPNVTIQVIEGPIVINNLGQVAFFALTSNGRAAMVYDPVIGLRVAARQSTSFQTDRGSRTFITYYGDSQAPNSFIRYLTDSGSLFLSGPVTAGGSMAVEFKVRFPADLNGDGGIDANDYLAFLNAYRSHARLADLNFDEEVDFNDYLEFLEQFNRPTW